MGWCAVVFWLSVASPNATHGEDAGSIPFRTRKCGKIRGFSALPFVPPALEPKLELAKLELRKPDMAPEKRNLALALILSIGVLLIWQLAFPPVPPPVLPDAQTTNETAPAFGEGEKTRARNFSPRLAIDTPQLLGSVSLRGARFDQLTLKNYRTSLDEDSQTVALLRSDGERYFAEFGWIAADTPVPDSDTLWTVREGSVLTPETPIKLEWDNQSGVRFELLISIDEEWLITIEQAAYNYGSTPVRLREFGRIVRFGTPAVSGFFILHEGLIGVFNERLQEIDYDTLREENQMTNDSAGGWLGFSDKYWLTALIPPANHSVVTRFVSVPGGGDALYQADFASAAPRIIEARGSDRITHRFFAGAKLVGALDRYSAEYNIPLFDRAVDFGWFYFITKPIFHALDYLFRLTGNFGVAILILTVFIKLLFFPLANKSYVSMSRMKLLTPEMQKLRQQFENDRQQMQKEILKLYKKHNVNPLAGCLPVLLQIPVFFALYKVLFVTIEMRHAPFFGWIHDLSAPDPLGVLTLFGLIDWNVPELLQIVNLGIWPIIMGASMWLQQKLNPPPPDPIQRRIFALMPIFFTFILARFPAGLVIYWAWNNTLTIIQQWTIQRRVQKLSLGKIS